MITSIRLKNFQAHKDQCLTFVPGVNVIVGPTNVGKSSVFRAVRWLVEHKPISGLQTFDTDDTQVRITTETGVVSRFKNNEGYGYRVNDLAPFVACGTNQPLEVQEVLGLSEINLQGQHDQPFLLTLTPGQMAKELNRIVDLSVIDKTMATVTSAASAAKSQVTAMEDILKSSEDRFQALAWVPAVKQEFDDLEQLDQKLQLAKLKSEKLLAAIVELRLNLVKSRELEKCLSELVELEKLMIGLDTAVSRQYAIAKAMANLREVSSSLTRINSAGKVLKGLSVDSAAFAAAKASFTSLGRLVQSYARIEGLETFWQALDAILAESAKIGDLTGKMVRLRTICRDWESIEARKTEQDKEIAKLEKEKPICPTCKRPL